MSVHTRMLVFGIALSPLFAAFDARAPEGHACPEEWLPVRQFSAPLAGARIRYYAPDLDAGGASGVIAGTPMLSSGLPENGLALTSLSGEDIAGPAGNFRFVFPQIERARGGALHMIWGEPDPSDSIPAEVRDYRDIELTSIWHSVYDRGRWSEPVRILEDTSDLHWSRTRARFVLDGSGAPHVAVAFGHLARSGVHYATRAAGEWKVRTLGGEFAVNASMSVAAGIAYVAFTDSYSGQLLIRLFRVRSDGRNLEVLGESQIAMDLDLMGSVGVVADSTGAQLFASVTRKGSTTKHLLHFTVRGDDRLEPDGELELTGSIAGYTVPVIDRCGVLHIIRTHFLAETESTLEHIRWQDGWSVRPLSAADAGFVHTHPALDVDAAGDVWAAWSRAPGGGPDTDLLSAEAVWTRMIPTASKDGR